MLVIALALIGLGVQELRAGQHKPGQEGVGTEG